MTQDFLLWSNCTNECEFCWQCKKRDETTFLSKDEMLNCIQETIKRLNDVNGDDVLLVGGEILAHYYIEVSHAIKKLIYNQKYSNNIFYKISSYNNIYNIIFNKNYQPKEKII